MIKKEGAKKGRQTRFGVKLSAFKCFFWVVWMSTNKAIKWFAQKRHKKLSAGKENEKRNNYLMEDQAKLLGRQELEKRKPPLTDCSCDRCCEEPWKKLIFIKNSFAVLYCFFSQKSNLAHLMTKITGPCSSCQRRSPIHNLPPPEQTFLEPSSSSLACSSWSGQDSLVYFHTTESIESIGGQVYFRKPWKQQSKQTTVKKTTETK